MIVARNRAAYVGPFDRICRGLRFFKPATTDSKEASPVYQNRRTPESAPAQLAGNGAAEAAAPLLRGPGGAPRPGAFEPTASGAAALRARSLMAADRNDVGNPLDARGKRDGSAPDPTASSARPALETPWYPRFMARSVDIPPSPFAEAPAPACKERRGRPRGIGRWRSALDGARTYGEATSIALAETLWPTRCAVCDLPGDVLCPECRRHLPFLDWWRACPRCGAPFGRVQCSECNAVTMAALGRTEPPFDACVSPVIYGDGAARIVRTWKDAGERRLAATMADLMAPVAAPVWRAEEPAVVPMPATAAAVRRRGFDHGTDLANELAARLGLPVTPLLARPRSIDQRRLTRQDRIRNMEHRFRALPGASAPDSVLLVDDVYTTGATLFAAADALRAAGAARVRCITFARVF